MPSDELAEIVGVRFGRRGTLRWYRAAQVEARVESWVVAELEGVETVGQVVVGREQLLEFPAEARDLPSLVRAARDDELPAPEDTAGRRLLETLPLRRSTDQGR